MIVTVSNQYGAGAIAISRLAALELGYDVVDRELPVVVAKRLSVSPDDVEAAESAGRSLGERLLSSLEMSTPEVQAPNFGETFDAECLREVQDAVREYAARGDVVIVGRAGALILGRRPDVLRIFMHAPRDWRIQSIARDLGLDAKAAAIEVDRIDRARKAHLREWYEADFGSPYLYDLSIDTATFGEAASAALIVSAVRSHR